MGQKLVQQQKLTQEQLQTLSGMQILVAKLTELPYEGLREYVENALAENPYLETAPSEAPEQHIEESPTYQEETETTYDVTQDYSSEDDIPDYVSKGHAYGLSALDIASETISSGENLSMFDQLIEQARLCNISEHQRRILEYLITSLDANGLLTKSIMQIVDELDIFQNCQTNAREVEHVLKMLQDFDPPGVGARSLQECLLLQYHRMEPLDPDAEEPLLHKILTRDWEDVSQNHWDAIKEKYEISDKRVNTLRQQIKKLNPRPGSIISETLQTPDMYIHPDVSITVDADGNIDYTLSEDDIPKLTVTHDADGMMDIAFVQDYVRRGNMFISAILQRRKNIMLAIEALIKHQRNYLLSGDEQNLRPMRLEDLAQATHLTVSTMSRICSGKYIETPYGTRPMRWFFPAEIKTIGEDNEATMRNLQGHIIELVNNEDKTNPLSDGEISDILAERGFNIARRTMAKYREQLGIPSSRKRKVQDE